MPKMQLNQVAGRHGSYATQFWRASGAPYYRSRADMRVAYSRKALNRRLVLPLDSHNWVRSLEVLDAGYARLGRTPEHYQAVLRDMVEHHGVYAELADSSTTLQKQLNRQKHASSGASSSSAHVRAAEDILPAIDELRDKAYAGEIPSNGSLWVTLVWSYCTLQSPQKALDTFHQAKRRFQFSLLTLEHMAELLLPALCRHGALEEATALYDEYLKPNAAVWQVEKGEPQPERRRHASRSNLDDAEARRWLAEAAARQGDWRKTQAFAAGTSTSAGETPRGTIDTNDLYATSSASNATDSRFVPRPTINSLFQSQGSVPSAVDRVPTHLSATLPHQQETNTGSASGASAATSSLPMLSSLSAVAVRRLFQTLCREASDSSPARTTTMTRTHAGTTQEQEAAPRSLTDALACWEHLYGSLPSSAGKGSVEVAAEEGRGGRRAPPPLEDVRELLNLFASHRRWSALLDFFSVTFLHRASSVYLDATPADVLSLQDTASADAAVGSVVASHHSHGDAATTTTVPPYAGEVPLDVVTLNLVFACLPKAAEPLRLRMQQTPFNGHVGSQVLALPAAARPLTVVRLLDDLLTYRDDMILTDVVMSVAGPALLQLGQPARVFELLVRTPMMVRARERKAAVQLSSHEQELKAVLVALGYAAYALCSSEQQRLDMVRRMPHLFPPEVVRRLAARASSDVASSSTSSLREDFAAGALTLAVLEGPVVTSLTPATPPSHANVSQSADKAAHTSKMAVSAYPSPAAPRTTTTTTTTPAVVSLLDRRWQLYTDPAHTQQPERSTAFSVNGTASAAQRRKTSVKPPSRSSATLTALADDAMRRDFVRLHDRRQSAFTGSHAAADRDPRPLPVGLHDHASGWDFFGRGGEKAFSNSTRTPHPFTMQPKVMRDLRNPYRGWNPRQNSSLAHKENVIKWNGKSAV